MGEDLRCDLSMLDKEGMVEILRKLIASSETDCF